MGKIQQAEDRQQVLECIRNGAGLTAKEVSDQLKQEGEFGKWSTKRVAALLVLLERAGGGGSGREEPSRLLGGGSRSDGGRRAGGA